MQKPKQGYKVVKSLFGKYEEIPENWEILPLSDLCKMRQSNEISSNLYIGLEHIGHGNNTLVSTGDTKNFTSNKNVFHRGDILYGKLRPLLNKVYRTTEDGYCSTDILPLIPSERIQGEILLRILVSQRFMWYAVSTSAGTKMPRTNWPDIKNFKAFVPPLKEQQKIASILSKVDELIQKTDQIIEQTQKLKKGLMHRLLTKGIGHDTFQRIRFNFLQLDIPHNWDVKLKNYVFELTDPVDTIILGRKMTDGFVSYWSGVMTKPDDPLYAFAKKMIETPMVVD